MMGGKVAPIGRICPRGRRSKSLCRKLAQGLAFSQVVPPCNLRIACSGAARVVFPSSIHCISLKSLGLVTNGTSNTRGIVHMGTAMGGFHRRAGVSIVARDKDFCAFGMGCTRRPLLLGVRVGSFVRSKDRIGHPGGTLSVCLGRLNDRSPGLMCLVSGSIRGGGGERVGRVKDGTFNVRCLLHNLCARGKLLCFRARVEGQSGMPCRISFIAFGVISGGIVGHATVRRRIVFPLHTCSCMAAITKGGSKHAIFILSGFAVPSSGILIIRVRRGDNKERRAFAIRDRSVIETEIVGKLGMG